MNRKTVNKTALGVIVASLALGGFVACGPKSVATQDRDACNAYALWREGEVLTEDLPGAGDPELDAAMTRLRNSKVGEVREAYQEVDRLCRG